MARDPLHLHGGALARALGGEHEARGLEETLEALREASPGSDDPEPWELLDPDATHEALGALADALEPPANGLEQILQAMRSEPVPSANEPPVFTASAELSLDEEASAETEGRLIQFPTPAESGQVLAAGKDVLPDDGPEDGEGREVEGGREEEGEEGR